MRKLVLALTITASLPIMASEVCDIFSDAAMKTMSLSNANVNQTLVSKVLLGEFKKHDIYHDSVGDKGKMFRLTAHMVNEAYELKGTEPMVFAIYQGRICEATFN